MGVIEKSKIKRFLLSLCISTFLWGYVTNMHNPIQTKTISNVPISIENIDVLESQNLAVDSSSTLSVNVTVEGRYSDIQNISTKDVQVTMDLDELALKEGSNNVSIEVSSLNANINIVKEKTPLQSKLEIVKLLQKEIPVIVNATGNLPDDYISGEAVLSKESVICSGTKESLNDIKYVSATVDYDGATSDISTLVQLKAINKLGEEAANVIIKDKELEILVPILYTKEVPIELKFDNNLPSGLKIDKYTLDKSTVVIAGSKEVLDTINVIYTEELDLSRRYYDFDKRLNLSFPDNVTSKNNTTSVYGSFVITTK